jgi:hypothetical protein
MIQTSHPYSRLRHPALSLMTPQSALLQNSVSNLARSHSLSRSLSLALSRSLSLSLALSRSLSLSLAITHIVCASRVCAPAPHLQYFQLNVLELWFRGLVGN